MIRAFSIAILVMLVSGCSGVQCDKARAYQQVRPQQPLKVPGDLSEPELSSRAPDPGQPVSTTRPDGRCLEEPPAYIPPQSSEDA